MDETELRKHFDERRPLWERFRGRLHALIEDLAREDDVSCQVASRVKTWPSVTSQLAVKKSTDLSQIQDIVGVRVIVDFWKDVDSIVAKLEREVAVDIDEVSRWIDDSRYQSIHFKVSVSGKRLELPEWRDFGGLTAEVQLRTAFADAFAKATHDLLYKFPTESSAAEKIDVAVSNTENLSRKLAEFRDLLDKEGVHEKQGIHPFLKNNSFILTRIRMKSCQKFKSVLAKNTCWISWSMRQTARMLSSRSRIHDILL